MTADAAPPPLAAQLLRETLPPQWRRLDVLGETGSTNADLIAQAAGGQDIAGAVLLAEHQTAGRGRSGRSWSGLPRALVAMSFGVSADGLPPDKWGWIPLATGVATVDAIRAVTGIRAGLKWPNDVLVDGRKLAGILAEVAHPSPVIIVGIGLNVTLRPQDIGEDGATSLRALGAEVDRTELVRRLLFELAERMGAWRAEGGVDEALMADYTARSVTIGTRVRALMPGDREIVGDAIAVDDQGRLVVDIGAETVAVSAGDIVHLRH